MTFQVQMSDEELIRRVNRKLTPELRQCAILIEFVEPIALPWLQHLTLCRLYTEQANRGEDAKRHRPRLTDPKWVARQKCHVCDGKIRQVGEHDIFVCSNPRCIIRGKRIAKATSHAGVVSVLWNRAFVEFYRDDEWKTTEDRGELLKLTASDLGGRTVRGKTPFLKCCIAALNKRYHPTELAAIYRTIGCLADQMGWKLKNPEG